MPFLKGNFVSQLYKQVVRFRFFYVFSSLCPYLQKSDHGQVLQDAVFKHLELTERDYFGLHLADDSSDVPVSIMFG